MPCNNVSAPSIKPEQTGIFFRKHGGLNQISRPGHKNRSKITRNIHIGFGPVFYKSCRERPFGVHVGSSGSEWQNNVKTVSGAMLFHHGLGSRVRFMPVCGSPPCPACDAGIWDLRSADGMCYTPHPTIPPVRFLDRPSRDSGMQEKSAPNCKSEPTITEHAGRAGVAAPAGQPQC